MVFAPIIAPVATLPVSWQVTRRTFISSIKRSKTAKLKAKFSLFLGFLIGPLTTQPGSSSFRLSLIFIGYLYVNFNYHTTYTPYKFYSPSVDCQHLEIGFSPSSTPFRNKSSTNSSDITHEISFSRAIGLNTLRDVTKTEESQFGARISAWEVRIAWDKEPSIFSRQIDATVYCRARHLIGCPGSWLGASEKRASEGKKILFFFSPFLNQPRALSFSICAFCEVSEMTLKELRQGLHILTI